jgi:uncharacterized membrane protein (UPF0127 family)
MKLRLLVILGIILIVFTATTVVAYISAKEFSVNQVELASTPEQHQKGLMGRQELCDDCAMLFTFPTPQAVSFWMKDTLIPLDLVMTDRSGVVQQVYRKAQPQSLSPLTADGISFVVEMNAGKANAIRVGDQVDINQLLSLARPH